jgi:hypothetical protein
MPPANGGGAQTAAARSGAAAARAPPDGAGAGPALQALLGREKWIDWAFVLLMFFLLGPTDAPKPAAPYILKAQLPDLAHPLLPNSVPSWSVPVLAIVVPAVLLGALSAGLRRPADGARGWSAAWSVENF